MLLQVYRRAEWPMVRDALYEVVTVSVLSMIPLIFAAFVAYVKQDPEALSATHRSFFYMLYLSTAGGQLVLYAISVWATVTWLAGKEYDKKFHHRLVFIVLSILGIAFCSLLIGIDPTLKQTQNDLVFYSSIFVYVVSVVCYFLIVLFEQIPPPSVSESNEAGAESLRNRLRARRVSDDA